MTPLIAAVFVASLLGSLHCAGMCGAFLALAVAPTDGEGGGGPSRSALNAAYNGGRLVTYIVLGAVAGLVGRAVDLGGSMAGVSRAAAVAAGALMVAFGLIAVMRASGVRLPRAPVPAVLTRLVSRGHHAAFGWPPLGRALAIGLLTTLLPCGWLYAFAITAAGTADPFLGALTMAAFWAGTLPVMIGLGVGVQALTGVARRHLPLATSILLVGVGLFTVFGRLASPAMARGDSAGADPSLSRVRSLPDQTPACCTDDR